MIQRLVLFCKEGIWKISLKDASKFKIFAVKTGRMLLAALHQFTYDNCRLRASGLTFYTLLSVVPVLAAAFGIAKGFGFEESLREEIFEGASQHREVIAYIVDFAHSALEQTQGGIVAGVGVFVLLWAIIRLMSDIEKAMNDIWRITKQRSIGRRFSDYLAMLIICPLFFSSASSLTVFFSSIGPLVALGKLLKLIPYILSCTLFTIIYLLMPNAKIKLRSALVGGILAGVAYQIVQFVYIKFQIGVANYGAIYGSFAALPLFLIWLQTSWMLVLLGAEICYVNENLSSYEFEWENGPVSNSFQRLVGLLITHRCIRAFEQGTPPLTELKLASELQIPPSLVDHTTELLLDAGILCRISSSGGERGALQPARDISRLTIKQVLDAMEKVGCTEISLAPTATLQQLNESLQYFDHLIESSPKNKLLKEIG